MKTKSLLALSGASANRQSSITLALAISALLSGPQAHAAVKTWTGTASSDLADPLNYTTANAPVATDSLVFGVAAGAGANTALTNTLTAAFSISAITFNSSASAYTITGNSFTLTGNIVNNSTLLETIGLNLLTTGVRTVSTNTGDITLGGVISGGGGGITKTGTGTLILSGANSFTGATTINGGVLNITGAMTAAAVGVTTVNSGTLLLSGASGRTGNAAAAGIVVNSNGSFILDNSTNNNGNRVFNTAQTTLNGGVYEFKGNTAADTTETMGTFNLGGPSTITLTLGSASFRTQIASPSLNYTAGTGAPLVNGVNLGKTSTPTTGNTLFTLTTPPTLVGTTAALTTGINITDKNTQIVPFLLGEATPTTGGTGTATGAANTFVTYVAGSGLRPLNLTDEFDTSTTFVAGNNVRVIAATSVSSDVAVNSMILDGAGVSIDDGFTLTNTSGALMFSSTNTIAPTATSGVLAFGSATGQITVLPALTATISAGISGTGGLVKNGTGDLVLSGLGSYTGPTSVNGGNVSFTGAYTPTDSASTLIVNNPNKGVGNAVALNLSTTLPTTVGSLSGATATPSSSTNTSKINNGGQLLTINQATAGSYDGVIEGAGGLTKTGSTLLSLSGIQTYAGPTIISAGTLEFNRAGASGDNTITVGSGVTVASGATLAIRALGTAATTSTISAPISLTGNGTTNSIDFPGGNNQGIAITGGISVSGGAIIRTFGLINTYTISGVGITGSGGLTFKVEGANTAANTNTVNFNVASTYTGNTTLNAFSQRTIFRLGQNDALPTTTSLSLIGGTAGSAGFTFANLDLNGKNQTLAGLTTTPNAGGANILNSVATASTLTVNSTSNQTIAGVLGGAAANNNNFLLTKTGAGILTLSGINTYTGATNVSDGTLLINGNSPAATGAMTVSTPGTLGGGGTIGGALTVSSGATLAPGAASATVGTLTAAAGASIAGSYTCDVNGATADRLAVTGTVTLSGPLTVNLLGGGFTQPSYIIAEGTTLSGTFSSVPAGYAVTYNATQAILSSTTDPYTNWIESFTPNSLLPGAASKLPTADPDADGISNLLEFVLTGSPVVSSQSINPTLTAVGSDQVLSYKRSDASETPATTQIGQWSTDLATWTPVTPVVVRENDTAADDMTITVPNSNAGAGKLFLRLNVVK